MRSLARLGALIALTAVSYALVVARSVWRTVFGKPRLSMQVASMHRWSARFCRLIGVEFEIEGTPPRPPFILVSNHLSYVDILVLAASSPGVFVAKSEIAGWPLVGAIARSVSTMFLEQRKIRDIARVNEEIGAILDEGVGIVLFPEGGIADGVSIKSFRSPLLQTAVETGRPVHHVTLGYVTPEGAPPAGEAISWPDGKNLPGHGMRLLGLPRFRAVVRFGDEPVSGGDRKGLARELERRVAARFTPLTGATPIPAGPLGDGPQT